MENSQYCDGCSGTSEWRERRNTEISRDFGGWSDRDRTDLSREPGKDDPEVVGAETALDPETMEWQYDLQ